RKNPLDVDVGDNQVLFKRLAAPDDVTRLVDHQAVAVKDQLVLTADQIAVGESHGVIFGPRAEHALAIGALIRMEGGSRDIDDQVSIARKRLHQRRTARIPDILADINADPGLAQKVNGTASARLKVTFLIKDAVVRQERLVVNVHQSA